MDKQQLKIIFGFNKVINSDIGTRVKILSYLHMIYPASATRTHIRHNANMASDTVYSIVPLLVNEGLVKESRRPRIWEGKTVYNVSYLLSLAGKIYISRILEDITVSANTVVEDDFFT